MIIDFTKNEEKLFTSVLYMVRQAQRSGKRFVVNCGGGGASKSVSQHQSELRNILTCDYDILFMRKVAGDIYDSCYMLLSNLAVAWGIYDQFTWVYSNQKRQIRNKATGHRIVFRGADDIGKLKSMVGIGRVILEEADAFTFHDFKEINRRARGFPNIQIVFILNPVDEDHWIKVMFVDDRHPNGKPLQGVYHDRTHVMISTYLDNKFATEDDIRELLFLKEVDENEYNIYALAKWGRLKTGSEFYHQFKESRHVTPTPFIPGLPVHLTYDFNVVPYMTLLCNQYQETDTEIYIRIFSEYCLSSPLNSVEAVSQAFVDDFEKWLTDIFYYGDASGNNRIAGKGDEVNYDDVRKVLFRFLEDGSNRVSSYNKPVLKRRKLMNQLFSGLLYYGKKRIIIQIDPSCINTIADFKYVILAKDGKLKEIVKDPRSGVTYQKYGHCSDAEDYFITKIFEELM